MATWSVSAARQGERPVGGRLRDDRIATVTVTRRIRVVHPLRLHELELALEVGLVAEEQQATIGGRGLRRGTPQRTHDPRRRGLARQCARAELEREFGIRVASDTRGHTPFLPVVAGVRSTCPSCRRTPPTLDELMGQRDLQPADPIEHLLSLTQCGSRDHVYTLHAEIEGGDCLGQFEALLAGWRAQGYRFTSLGEYAAQYPLRDLPRCEIVSGRVQGRAGTLAMQGAQIRQTSDRPARGRLPPDSTAKNRGPRTARRRLSSCRTRGFFSAAAALAASAAGFAAFLRLALRLLATLVGGRASAWPALSTSAISAIGAASPGTVRHVQDARVATRARLEARTEVVEQLVDDRRVAQPRKRATAVGEAVALAERDQRLDVAAQLLRLRARSCGSSRAAAATPPCCAASPSDAACCGSAAAR